MDSLLTQTLTESVNFEKEFAKLEKAATILNCAKKAYRKYNRKIQALDSSVSVFPEIHRKTKHQAEIALMAYNKLFKAYRRTVSDLDHNV